MSFEVRYVKLEIGFDFQSLSEAAAFHERTNEFKHYVQQEYFEKIGAHTLAAWRNYPTAPQPPRTPFPEPDATTGHIPDAKILDWLRRNLQSAETGWDLSAGEADLAKWCTYDPDGMWRKSRIYALSLEGQPWTCKTAAAEYAKNHAPDIAKETLDELERVRARAFVTWNLVETSGKVGPASDAGAVPAASLMGVESPEPRSARAPTARKTRAGARKTTARKKATRKKASRKSKAARKKKTVTTVVGVPPASSGDAVDDDVATDPTFIFDPADPTTYSPPPEPRPRTDPSDDSTNDRTDDPSS